MRSYLIIVDTNVLLAGLRSRRGASYKLLTILNDDRWQLNISTTLVFEYEEVLKREKEQLGLSFEDIDNLLDGTCHIANKRSIFYLWRSVMRNPITDLNVQIPDSLYKQIPDLAERENISIAQIVAITLFAQVSAWKTKDYLEDKPKRGSWKKFQQVLTKVPDVEPEDYDKL